VTADRRRGGPHLARLLPPRVNTRWQHAAACRDVRNPDIFFPGKEDSEGMAAKRICASCPVLAECLDFALTTMPRPDRDFGVYGGLLPVERARLRGGLTLIPDRKLEGRAQAAVARKLADAIGEAATARALGVTLRALTDAWARYRLLTRPPPSRRQAQVSRLRADLRAARAAFELAGRVGVVRAAAELGVSHGSLYRAWERHGLGRPTPPARVRPQIGRRSAASRTGLRQAERDADGGERP
jgi:WhiB family redox-sensing transcriptional regulator